jgi:hypothetical protein
VSADAFSQARANFAAVGSMCAVLGEVFAKLDPRTSELEARAKRARASVRPGAASDAEQLVEVPAPPALPADVADDDGDRPTLPSPSP